MTRYLLLWVLFAGVALLLLMGVDKNRAKKGQSRIPEATLFSWAVLGGAWGGWIGMLAFRHKTRHWYFRFGLPLLTLCWLWAVLWVLVR